LNSGVRKQTQSSVQWTEVFQGKIQIFQGFSYVILAPIPEHDLNYYDRDQG